MSYLSGWRTLSSRISGLVAAGNLLCVQAPTSVSAVRDIREHCSRVVDAAREFASRYSGTLPAEAGLCLQGAISKVGPYTADATRATLESQRAFIATALVMLTAFESEMSFILSDNQAEIRTRAERAFEHLQRSIVADPATRERWKVAFAEGETACEKLGAAHLLSHGIWAFKTNAEGGRTDLVYQEPIEQPEGGGQRAWS
jgi:hypothetical protein